MGGGTPPRAPSVRSTDLPPDRTSSPRMKTTTHRFPPPFAHTLATVALAASLFCVGAPHAHAATQLYATLGNGSVDTFSATGTASASATGFNRPEGLTFDSAGNLYVADRNEGTVTKTTPAGVRTTLYTTQGILVGLASDPAGNVYAAIDGGVVKITPAGTVSMFGPNADSTGLAFDAAGDLFVASAQNSIYKIPAGSTTGMLFASGGGLSTPFALTINPAGTLLYAANADGNSILTFPWPAARAVCSPRPG